MARDLADELSTKRRPRSMLTLGDVLELDLGVPDGSEAGPRILAILLMQRPGSWPLLKRTVAAPAQIRLTNPVAAKGTRLETTGDARARRRGCTGLDQLIWLN